jgi:hypothetical protein
LPGTSEDTACKSTYKFRKLKNRVLRKVFRSKGTRAIGRWRKLYIEVLHGLYSSSNIIRVIRLRRRRWMENVAAWKRNSCRVLEGKPEGKKPLGRPRSR